MNTQKWVGIGIVAIVLIVIAYFTGQSSNNSSTPTYTPTSQNQSTTQPSGTENQVTPSQAAQRKSLPDIVKEWGKSTAYVDCYWSYPTTSAYPANGNPMGSYEQTYLHKSGSGLLATLNSTPTVITNKHVVDDSQYGLATECDVGFHDDNHVFYSITTVVQPAQSFTYSQSASPITLPEIPQHGQIQFDAGGNDVAYLSNMKEENIDNDLGVTPSISLTGRTADSNFVCGGTTPIGESLVVLGYPDYGSGAGTITNVLSNLQVTATEGIISGQDGAYYTTSAKIDPGNSGGLAIDEGNDCYIGIPSAAVVGEIESLGRILPTSTFLH